MDKLDKEAVKKIIYDLMIENGASLDRAESLDGDDINEYLGYGDVKSANGYSISETDQFGGEGQGDDYWYVYTLTDEAGNETPFRVSGYYDSWNGTEWDHDIDLVKPVEVTVIRWSKI